MTVSAASNLGFTTRMQQGINFEKSQVATRAREYGNSIVIQKTLVPNNGLGNVVGNRTRVDGLRKNDDGSYSIFEDKSTNKTALSRGQSAAQNQVISGGGSFTLRSDIKEWGLEKNDTIDVKDYIINYKEVLP